MRSFYNAGLVGDRAKARRPPSGEARTCRLDERRPARRRLRAGALFDGLGGERREQALGGLLVAHIAEKLHAYTMPRPRPNSRVKDLPDLALLASIGALEASRLAEAPEQTFTLRKTHALPASLPGPNAAWESSSKPPVVRPRAPA